MAFFAFAPGHGAGDPGAVLGLRKEKDDNLRLSLAVEAEMKKRGHRTAQFRTNDSVNCDWQSCRTWLAKVKADFSVVFHRNAFNGSALGVEVWSYDADASISAKLSAAIAAAAGFYNRGRKANGAAWLNSSVRCCQIEAGFLDNASDNEKFDKNFGAIVKAVCDVLETEFGKGSPAIDSGVIARGTTTNYLNIRRSAVNGAVLTSMPTGSICDIYSIENGWAKLYWNGYEGYSSVDYMKIEYVKKEEPKAEVKEEPKKETATEKETPAEPPKTPSKSEEDSTKETAPKKEEVAVTPPQASGEKMNADSLDDTVPAFIKLLKKIIEIIVKIWRK